VDAAAGDLGGRARYDLRFDVRPTQGTPVIRALFASAALLCLAASAQAQSPATVQPTPRTLGYLPAVAIDGAKVLGPPPAAGSPQDRADRATYDETRALAGTDRWKTAIQDNDLWQGGAMKRYACALGVDLSEKHTPITFKMLHKLELDVRTFGTPPKDFYNRKRPALDNDKPVCVPREAWMTTNASYPSGHAMNAWSWALILTEARPDKATELLKLGREGGESRVICGVHYPSDIEAGRSLGAGMVARLHADPVFVADLAAVKQELNTVKAAPSGCEG
jgi:acid phosphatase (class A)